QGKGTTLAYPHRLSFLAPAAAALARRVLASVPGLQLADPFGWRSSPFPCRFGQPSRFASPDPLHPSRASCTSCVLTSHRRHKAIKRKSKVTAPTNHRRKTKTIPLRDTADRE